MVQIQKKRKRFARVTAVIAGLLFAFPAFAQQVDTGIQFATAIGLGTADIRTVVARVISAFLGLLGIVAVGLILYGGFLWMTAAGKPEQVDQAKRVVVNATIGLIIITSAYAITLFVFRALGQDTTGTGFAPGAGGCPPGQSCSFGAGAGGGGFSVTGIAPAGPGPGASGWPKNSSAVVNFNSDVAPASVTSASVVVRRCNPRVNGSGSVQPFDPASCGEAVTGTRSVSGSRVSFRPDATAGEFPNDLEGDRWYTVTLPSGAVRDVRGRSLLCPFHPPGPEGDIAGTTARASLCERAFAVGLLRDVAPPTASIESPLSVPGYCAEQVRIVARADDDVMVSAVDFTLDGRTEALTDVDGNSLASAANPSLALPFVADSVFFDASPLDVGPHTLSAVPFDGVPQPGAAASRTFLVNPPNCCNVIQDSNESGLNCGPQSGCGSCAGGSCAASGDCQSGSCVAGRCEDRPLIEEVDRVTGGAGTLITLRGRGFGSTPGTVIFLGADTDADGDAVDADAAQSDDAPASACAASAWRQLADGAFEAVVAVPASAKTGPLRLVTSTGASDRTDDDKGPVIGAVVGGRGGNFTVSGATLPGICAIAPVSGPVGTAFTISGNGFGSASAGNFIKVGGRNADIAPGGWAENGASVTAVVPSTVEEGLVRVRAVIGGISSNETAFNVRAEIGAVAPRIQQVIPESATIGTTVTVIGAGFGSGKGTVRLRLGNDVALALDASCAESWRDTAIVFRVPEKYEPLTANAPLQRALHKLEVVTASPSRTSAPADLTIIDGAPRPGICSIEPDNGPSGTPVTVQGDGFGSGPASAAPPRFSVEFAGAGSPYCSVDPATNCTAIGLPCADPNQGICYPPSVSAKNYGAWTVGSVTAFVPGERGKPATQPKTGPVFVIANNGVTSNALPFTVQDCGAAGASCAVGASCCGDGACRESCVAPSPESAFGWRFSTGILPSLPVVVDCASCGSAACAVQSPSPYRGSRDACRNAIVTVVFNKKMDRGAMTPDVTVRLEKCGGTEQPDCSAARITPLSSLEVIVSDGGSLLRASPSATFEPSAWYRVTLVSDPAGGNGLRDIGGRFLDGDADRREGGDYVFTFRTNASAESCAVSSVGVLPPKFTIDHAGLPPSVPGDPEDGFMAGFTAANCNALACTDPRTVSWSASDALLSPAFLSLPADLLGCRLPVTAARETAPGGHVLLTASARRPGESSAKEGSAQVSVKFADPVVTSFTPNCQDACVNGDVSALFNIPIDPGSIVAGGNAELFRCRNASCVPPHEPDLDAGAERRAQAIVDDEGNAIGVRFVSNGESLPPSSHFVARLKGGANGIKSTSDVGLKALNDGAYFSWTFRTKDDGTPCAPNRVSISPAESSLRFVGERLALQVTAVGAPDECSSKGQQLEAADYDWQWSLADPGSIIAGFLDGLPTTPSPSKTGGLVDAKRAPRTGCSGACLLRGSQTAVPQCGNGTVERGEECDPALVPGTAVPGSSAACTNLCVFSGTSSLCGNNVVEGLAESCDKVADTRPAGERDPSGFVFPPGCKDPAVSVAGRPELDGKGCVLLGASSAYGSTCGDGRIGEGEACDDGNRANGDGCNAICLKEGTLPSCLGASIGSACVNFCGNGKVEPGEDASCELNPGVAAGCNVATCLKKGTSPCGAGGGTNCCGNGSPDPGEDGVCDNTSGLKEFCTGRCLLKGSSETYADPSFCGDGVVGAGENAVCEGLPAAGDGKTDPRQILVAGLYDPRSGAPKTATVTSTTVGVPSEGVGRASVSLECTCGSLPEDQRDAACSAIRADLACAVGGCCVPRPGVTDVTPRDGSNGQCRNVAVTLVFDRRLDSVSVKQGLLIGSDLGSTGQCPAGTEEVPLARVEDVPAQGIVRSFLKKAAQFVHSLIVRAATGAAPAPLVQSNTFCLLPGDITVADEGGVTTATWSPRQALPSNTWVRVRILPTVHTDDGVSVGGTGFIAHFGAGADVCPLQRVTVRPESALFAKKDAPDVSFVAQGISENGSVIAPTPQQNWSWQWTPQPSAAPFVSRIVLVPGRAGDPPDQTDTAKAHVRGRDGTDELPGFGVADGTAQVEVSAAIIDPTTGVEVRRVTGTAQASVMLCENPWPARHACGAGGTVTLPWDPASPKTCAPGAEVWYPFYDPATNVEFFYCRDTERAGDLGDILPALDETRVVVVTPGRGIVKEFLFTYQTPGPWEDDAIGLRISKNLNHFSTPDWYADQGFRGSPQPLIVDGYGALREGRTVYVNAAARTPSGLLFTNVNVLSFSDAAAPETVEVFGRILSGMDFNREASLQDRGFCRDELGAPVSAGPDRVLACDDDLDCRVTAEGRFDDALKLRTCDAAKTKLRRDVRRWGDLMGLRADILAKGAGNFPTVEAGTFLRGRSFSPWGSWTGAFTQQLGAVPPTDPLSKFAGCPADADPATCWNEAAGVFQCPAGSHVYEYQAIGGQDFRLRADLEFRGGAWSGDTCIERVDQTACQSSSDCVWIGTRCEFAVGKVEIGGVINSSDMCQGAQEGASGRCGDGIVQTGEQCEPNGPADVQPCQIASGSPPVNRTGAQVRTCTTSCTFGAFGACQAGRCGDGVVQSPELCDDGPLNGSYGHCRGDCAGQGLRCGDHAIQPQERCDCGKGIGMYAFNGVLQRAGSSCARTGVNAYTCAFDCSSAGPRCGDGVINDTEQCDGGLELFRGFCNDKTQTGCDTTADCPAGSACGNFCQTVEQKRRRACNGNDPASSTDDASACKWGQWVCTAPGQCGNGVKETGEECDDGNADNADGCVIDAVKNVMCKTARCGDGYYSPSAEQCDDGARNGIACVADYGASCSFCAGQCRIGALTGGFCGNGLVEGAASVPPGPEECDGTSNLGHWLCVSSLPPDQSFGRIVGQVVCSSDQCLRSCDMPNARACFNDPAVSNTDKDPLVDSCDPDIDDDGVPNADAEECGASDKNVHGAYVFGKFEVDAAPEICDGKDNDCDDFIDNTILIRGLVKDGKTGQALQGATVRAYCNTTQLASTQTADAQTVSGSFRLTTTTGGFGQAIVMEQTTDSYEYNYEFQFKDEGRFAACNSVVTIGVEEDGFCFAQSQRVGVPVDPSSYCQTQRASDIVMTAQPPVGQFSVVLTWGNQPANLDASLRYTKQGGVKAEIQAPYRCVDPPIPETANCSGVCSNDRNRACAVSGDCPGVPGVCISSRGTQICSTNRLIKCPVVGRPCRRPSGVCQAYTGPRGAVLDVDDRDGNGPETLTINAAMAPIGTKWRYYVVQNDEGNGLWSTNPAEVRVWGNSCADVVFRSDAATGVLFKRVWNVFELAKFSIEGNGQVYTVTGNNTIIEQAPCFPPRPGQIGTCDVP